MTDKTDALIDEIDPTGADELELEANELELELAAEADHGCDCGCDDLPEDAKAVVSLREVYHSDHHEPGHGQSDHEQTPFLGFEVDSKLRELIENLWILDMPTDFSCEGHPELLHPLLFGEEYHAQIVFLRLADGIRFFSLITAAYGAGTNYSIEGFSLVALDGDDKGALPGETPQEYADRLNPLARAEVRFHPGFIEPIAEIIDREAEGYGHFVRRKAMNLAKTPDEAYAALGIDSEIRERAELVCDCGHDH